MSEPPSQPQAQTETECDKPTSVEEPTVVDPSLASPDPLLSIQAARPVTQCDVTDPREEKPPAAAAAITPPVSDTTTPGSTIISSGVNETSLYESSVALSSLDPQRRASSGRSTRSYTNPALPDEVLRIIFEQVGLPDLWGSVQYVNRAWYRVAVNHILTNPRFLDLLLAINFQAFEYTYSGFEEDEDARPAELDDDDSCWSGVSIDSDDMLKYFPELLTGDYCENGSSFRLYLQPQGLASTREKPLALSFRVFTLSEVATYRRRCNFWSVSIGEADTVLLEPLSFDLRHNRLVLDITQCYARLYKIYLTAELERRSLTNLLEADLWSHWARQNGKFWGKKKAGIYFQGAFIDYVQDLLGTYRQWHSLESLLERWDLLFRKSRRISDLSLDALERYNFGTNFHRAYQNDAATWQDPRQADFLPAVSIREGDGARFNVHTKWCQAFFAPTFLHLAMQISPAPGAASILNFSRRRTREPINYLEKCMPQEAYNAMFDTWYREKLARLQHGKLIKRTLMWQLSDDEETASTQSEESYDSEPIRETQDTHATQSAATAPQESQDTP